MTENLTTLTFRVRYAETDQMAVAYYGSYATWLEIARTEYCRERGIRYRELEDSGTGIVVAEMWLKYRRPVRYDDLVDISVWIEEIGRRSMTFCYKIHKIGKLVTEAYTKHVFVDMMEKRPVAVPPDLVKFLTRRPEENIHE